MPKPKPRQPRKTTEPEPAEETDKTTESEPCATEKIKQVLVALSDEVRIIARAIPTPGVTESHAHSAALHKIADRLIELAGEL